MASAAPSPASPSNFNSEMRSQTDFFLYTLQGASPEEENKKVESELEERLKKVAHILSQKQNDCYEEMQKTIGSVASEIESDPGLEECHQQADAMRKTIEAYKEANKEWQEDLNRGKELSEQQQINSESLKQHLTDLQQTLSKPAPPSRDLRTVYSIGERVCLNASNNNSKK